MVLLLVFMQLTQKSLSLHLRKRMVKVFVWSVVLYGSETWSLQKEDSLFGDFRHLKCG